MSYTIMMSTKEIHHPVDTYLQDDAVPSVCCPGCGIGTTINAFLRSIEEAGLDPSQLAVVSGFGCTARIADYLNIRTHAVEDGHVCRYGARLSDENPDLRIVVFSNNTDLLLTRAEDFIEQKEIGSDLLVIHVNNYFYIVTENEFIPTTPLMRTTEVDFSDVPYNIPRLAKASGAIFIARWTPYHAGWLKFSIMDAFSRQGLSVVEVVSPCLLYYANERRIGDTVERIQFYSDQTEMRNTVSFENLDLRANEKIVVGQFLDER